MLRYLKIAFLVAFFTSTLSLAHGDVFLSPDENAAYQFTQQLITRHNLAFAEPRNASVGNVIRARSATILGDSLVPGSFLGLPIVYGVIGTVLAQMGLKPIATSLLLLTPLLATLALAAWYLSLKQIFANERLATFATILLAIHPAFWYWTSRAMMHNVAFVSCLIFALYFATKKKGSRLESGFLIGLALFFRTSEALWVLPVTLGLLLTFRTHFTKKTPLAFVGGLFAMLLLIGYSNALVYGAPWQTGYTVTSSDASTDVHPDTGSDTRQQTGLKPVSTSWSLHPRTMLRNVWYYGFSLYPILTLLGLLGSILMIRHEWPTGDRRYRALLLATLFIAFALILVYGTWTTIDNPDPHAISIGNSHVRYWLPLFVLSSLFGAYALERLTVRIRETHAMCLYSAVIVLTLLTSAPTVLLGGDGILAARAALDTFALKRAAILNATPTDAIVIVDRADKYLFPYRAVVTPLRDPRTYASLPTLVQTAPLYYFGITLPEVDIAYLNTTKLAPDHLRIAPVLTINEESLYLITAY